MDALEQIEFVVSLPPASLRANSRAHWATKKRDADSYSLRVVDDWLEHCQNDGFYVHSDVWQKAHVLYVWKYAGSPPDHGNLGGNTKYLQDILCCAPKLSPKQAEKYKRWHLGLVEDDAGITAEYRAEKVARKDQECVEVTIRKMEDAPEARAIYEGAT